MRGKGGLAVFVALAMLATAMAAFPPVGPRSAIAVLNYHGNAFVQRELVDDLAAEEGWTVTHVDAAAFAAMSGAGIDAYDVLLIASGAAGDPPCGSDQWRNPLDYSGLLANPNVGAATMDGRKVITSLDPDWHGADLFQRTEREIARKLLRNMVAWVGAGDGTGYIALSDGSSCGMWWTQEGSILKPLLDPPNPGFEYVGLLQAAFVGPWHPIRSDLPAVFDHCCHHGRFRGPVPGFTFLMEDPTSGLGMMAIQDGPPANRAPRIAGFTANAALEGSPLTFTVDAVDDDRDALTYSFDFTSDGTFDVTGPSATATHVFGDDFDGWATVEVSDGTERVTADTPVHVSNVAPSLRSLDVQVPGTARVTLRVAGEKFHDVAAVLRRNGTGVGAATIVRQPGSPDAQAVVLGDLDAPGTYAAAVTYTPRDDPVNGQVWGATPAWIILDDGVNRTSLHHLFNAGDNATWTWTVDDLGAFGPSLAVGFTANVYDPGSDDVRTVWDFGDGGSAVQVFLLDPSGSPDSYPSPDVNPRSITANFAHTYAAHGTYTVTITIEDDDGGSLVQMFDVVV